MSEHKRPKTLYFYENKELQKHKVTLDCMPEVSSFNSEGTRWRCRLYPNGHDHYGYAGIKEAKVFEIHQTKRQIYSEQGWLKKLQKTDDLCAYCGGSGVDPETLKACPDCKPPAK